MKPKAPWVNIPHPTLWRADGTKSYNSYLWPLPEDNWWLSREHGHRFSSRWHLYVIALNDGRYATTGCTFSIERNQDGCCGDQPCVFPTREAAVRTAAARTIRTMRGSRHWNSAYDSLRGPDLEFAINWVLQKVTDVCKKPHRPIRIKEPPAVSQAEPPPRKPIPQVQRANIWSTL